MEQNPTSDSALRFQPAGHVPGAEAHTDPIRPAPELAGPPGHALVALDADGVIRHWGREAEATGGLSAKDAHGRRPGELASDNGDWERLLAEAAETDAWCDRLVALPAGLVRAYALARPDVAGFSVLLCDASQEQRAVQAHRLVLQILSELGNAEGLEDGLASLLRVIGTSLQAPAVEAWVRGADGRLHGRGAWAASDPLGDALWESQERWNYAPGEDLPGRAILRRSPVRFTDLPGHPAFRRNGLAARYGLRTAVAVPLRAGDFEAVVLVFDPHGAFDLDNDFVQALHASSQALRSLAAREGLERSRAAMHGVFAHVQDCALLQLDRDGHIVHCNQGAARLFGASVDALMGLHTAALFPDGDADAGAPERELTLAATLGTQERECWQRRINGSRFLARRVVGAGRASDGELYGYWVFVLDATPARKAEQAEHRMRELSETNASLERFAVQASHDLNEPLQVMRSCLDAVQEEVDHGAEAEAKVFLDHAREECERLSGIVRGLLRLARPMELQRRPVDLGVALERVVQRLAGRIRLTGGRITGSSLPMVQADPELVEQLLQNLIENALKHHGGTPSILVRAEEGPVAAVISVEDDGRGLTAGDAERLFEPHERGDGSEGLGLGLSICRLIVSRHGGRIWAEPSANGGARFRFTLEPTDDMDRGGAARARAAGG